MTSVQFLGLMAAVYMAPDMTKASRTVVTLGCILLMGLNHFKII